MAVIDDIPGLQVQVVVNGEPLHEHNDDKVEDVPKTITKYVEIGGESTFEILTQFLDNFNATYGVRVEVRLDGIKVHYCFHRLGELKKAGGHKSSGVLSKIDGRWHMSNLMFSSFAFEEDNGRKLGKATDDRLRQTGTITVLLHRIKNIRWSRRSRQATEEKANVSHGVTTFGKVPENIVQALGLSHHGSVDKPEKKRTGTWYCYDYVDSKEDEHAFATFKFKYRSLDTLKALGIVARTPEPTSTPAPPHSRETPATATPGPGPASASSAQPSNDGQDGLSIAEIIAVIGTYRGHTDGLNGLNKKELLGLLGHHRSANIPVRGIKRERDEDVRDCGNEKLQKRDVIAIEE